MKNRLWLIVGGVCLFAASSVAQDRYIVHFSDKDNSAYSVNNPSEFLSQKAIQRRTDQNIEITEQDFPVNQQYVQGVASVSSSVETYFTSKWWNAVLVQCDNADAALLEDLPFVTSVEYVGPGTKLTRDENAKIKGKGNQRKRNNKVSTGATDAQNAMLGLDVMHEMGFTGAGVDIAVMDGGFEGVSGISYFEHLFSKGNIKYTYDYVTAGTNVYRYSDHGTRVLSLMGGYAPGEFEGSA
jgi:serine protease AprX